MTSTSYYSVQVDQTEGFGDQSFDRMFPNRSRQSLFGDLLLTAIALSLETEGLAGLNTCDYSLNSLLVCQSGFSQHIDMSRNSSFCWALRSPVCN